MPWKHTSLRSRAFNNQEHGQYPFVVVRLSIGHRSSCDRSPNPARPQSRTPRRRSSLPPDVGVRGAPSTLHSLFCPINLGSCRISLSHAPSFTSPRSPMAGFVFHFELKYSSRTIKFTLLKCTISFQRGHEVVQPSPVCHSRTFSLLQKGLTFSTAVGLQLSRCPGRRNRFGILGALSTHSLK